VWLEHRIDVTGHASGVVSLSHGGPANQEDIRHDATTGQALAERRERSLDVCPAEENVIRFGHAASKSLADR
jgi:hypothetical protein